MVAEQVGQRPVRADGETRRAREVIFRNRRPLFLVLLTNIVRGHAANDGFDLFPIRIIDKTRGGRARDRNEAVFSVIREIEGLSPNVARDHIAVGVVGIGVAIRERGHRVFVIRIVRRVIDSAFAGKIAGHIIVAVGHFRCKKRSHSNQVRSHSKLKTV